MIPQEGTLSEMVDIYDLVRELKLSDEEKKLVNYKEGSLGASWNADKDPNKDITINSEQLSIVQKGIDRLDTEGKINVEQVPLILKIRNG